MSGGDMSKDLDERLYDVFGKLQDIYTIGPEITYEEAVAQIKAAFQEAGYAVIKKVDYRDRNSAPYTQVNIQYPDGSGEFARVPQFAYMTGQEWYDAFEKELESYVLPGKQVDGTNLPWVHESHALEAARKAAGLDHD